MTIKELETLQDILQWARGKATTDGMFVRINLAKEFVDREIRNKSIDRDVSGNSTNRGE